MFKYQLYSVVCPVRQMTVRCMSDDPSILRTQTQYMTTESTTYTKVIT